MCFYDTHFTTFTLFSVHVLCRYCKIGMQAHLLSTFFAKLSFNALWPAQGHKVVSNSWSMIQHCNPKLQHNRVDNTHSHLFKYTASSSSTLQNLWACFAASITLALSRGLMGNFSIWQSKKKHKEAQLFFALLLAQSSHISRSTDKTSRLL